MRWSSMLLAVLGLGLITGACDREFLPERDPAPWVLRAPVTDEARQIRILTEEQNCAGGERADRRTAVTVEETADVVTITVKIRRPTGFVACPSNPWTPVEVQLGSDLGGRVLIDGATSEVREYPDVLTSVTLGSPAADVPAISSVSRSNASSGDLPALECEAAELPSEATRASWMSDHEVVPNDPDLLLGYAVHRFGLKPTGWHQFTSPEPFGRSSYVWLQFLDGILVGQVSAQTVLIGHNLLAHTCGGGAWAPDEEAPDEVPFESSEQAPELDIAGILVDTSGLVLSDDRVSFADPNNRCRAWIALEDNLESAGLTVQQTVGYTDTPALEASVETQIIALISDRAGAATLVSTAPGGLLEFGPAPQSSYTADPPRFSWLQPCPLDTPIAVDVQPLT